MQPRRALLRPGLLPPPSRWNSVNSGHAAYSFCAATVMALYIWGKLRVFSRTEKVTCSPPLPPVTLLISEQPSLPGPPQGSFSKLLAGMLPLAGAAFIAAT